MNKGLSRRAFLGLGATAAAAAGVAGLAGCAPQQSGTASSGSDSADGAASGVAPTEYTPDFLTPPPVPTEDRKSTRLNSSHQR